MIYLLIGIQGAGKTTFANEYAKNHNMVIISTDMVRKNNPGIKEELVWPYVYEQVAINAKNNLDVIFDATSITPKVRKRFMDEVNKYNVNTSFGAYFFETDKNECYNRVVKRNTMEGELFLPPEVVYSYSERLVKPTLDEGFSVIYIVKDGKVVEEING